MRGEGTLGVYIRRLGDRKLNAAAGAMQALFLPPAIVRSIEMRQAIVGHR